MRLDISSRHFYLMAFYLLLQTHWIAMKKRFNFEEPSFLLFMTQFPPWKKTHQMRNSFLLGSRNVSWNRNLFHENYELWPSIGFRQCGTTLSKERWQKKRVRFLIAPHFLTLDTQPERNVLFKACEPYLKVNPGAIFDERKLAINHIFSLQLNLQALWWSFLWIICLPVGKKSLTNRSKKGGKNCMHYLKTFLSPNWFFHGNIEDLKGVHRARFVRQLFFLSGKIFFPFPCDLTN